MKAGFLFALATIAAIAGTAAATHICRGRPVIAAPVCHAPVVSYAHHVEKVIVPKAVEVAVAPYHFSVSDGYRDALLADAIAYRVLTAMQGKAASTAPVPRYKEPASPPMGRADAGSPGPSSGAALAKVLESRCAKCHTGKNGIDLSAPDKVPKGQRWHAYALSNSGEMPKGASPIPDDEVKLLYAWAQAAK